MSSELLPASFPTLSGCLADFAFEFWWNEENAAAATRFGVAESRLAELVSWYLGQFDRTLGAPDVAFSTSIITEFLAEFVDDASGLTILGGGLSEDHRARLLEEKSTPPEAGEYGVFSMLEANNHFDSGGTELGFELVSYEYGLEHSWLCNSLEREVHARLGVSPNPATGLVDSFEKAVLIADYINQDEVGAEPGLWLPWLVVEYPV